MLTTATAKPYRGSLAVANLRFDQSFPTAKRQPPCRNQQHGVGGAAMRFSGVLERVEPVSNPSTLLLSCRFASASWISPKSKLTDGTLPNCPFTNLVSEKSWTNALDATCSSAPTWKLKLMRPTLFSSRSTPPPRHKVSEPDAWPTLRTANCVHVPLPRCPPPIKLSSKSPPCQCALPKPLHESCNPTTKASTFKSCPTPSSLPKVPPLRIS
mmetsp:Transcript_12847/g.28979  ORF Transcript_12847/g.28979 Transcript_12847/m.28979 type:complete len:212 (-) Transcript_12847:601-1236(-)